MRCPRDEALGVLCVGHLQGDELVAVACGGGDLVVVLEGGGIDEEFEGGAWLTHGGDLVVFPTVKIDVTHPGTHITGLRFHCHKSTVHKPDHVADGVHRTHLFLHEVVGLVVVEDLHLVGLVHVVVDGVGVVVELLRQLLVVFAADGYVLDEVGDFLTPFVTPRGLTAPMAMEALLNEAHLLLHSLFSIALKTGVEGRVDAQSIGVEVDVVGFRPCVQILLDGFAEIEGTTIVGLLHGIVQVDGYLCEGVQFVTGQFAVGEHVVEHDVATLEAVLGVDLGVVGGGGFQESHEDCRLLCGEILGRGLEVGLGCRLDAEDRRC